MLFGEPVPTASVACQAFPTSMAAKTVTVPGIASPVAATAIATLTTNYYSRLPKSRDTKHRSPCLIHPPDAPP